MRQTSKLSISVLECHSQFTTCGTKAAVTVSQGGVNTNPYYFSNYIILATDTVSVPSATFVVKYRGSHNETSKQIFKYLL